MRNIEGQLKFTLQTTYEHKDDHVENLSKVFQKGDQNGSPGQGVVQALKKNHNYGKKYKMQDFGVETIVGAAAVSADDNDDGSGSCLHSFNVYLCCNNMTSVISF